MYHAGMTDKDRRETQDAFGNGRARVVVATNLLAWVDRKDVRLVIHADLPRSLEGYYQEAGRAGRDGQPAQCLLLHSPGDQRTHEFLIELNCPKQGLSAEVWRHLHSSPNEYQHQHAHRIIRQKRKRLRRRAENIPISSCAPCGRIGMGKTCLSGPQQYGRLRH